MRVSFFKLGQSSISTKMLFKTASYSLNEIVKNFMLLIVVFIIRMKVGFAIEIQHEEVTSLLEKSKSDPTKLFVLEIGATWCHACHDLEQNVSKIPPDSDQNIAKTYWSQIDNDKDEATLNAFMNKFGLPQSSSFPRMIVIKGGTPIGEMHGSNDLNKINKFLDAAKLVDPSISPASTKQQSALTPPNIPCSEIKKEDPCQSFIAASGPASSKGVDATDVFGMSNLISLKKLFNARSFVRLFGNSTNTLVDNKVGSDDGIFYVKNPLADFMPRSVENISALKDQIDNLKDIPGNDIRIFLTGHGTPFGLRTTLIAPKDRDKLRVISIENEYPLKIVEPNGNTSDSSEYLSVNDTIKGVTEARKAGKTIRTLSVQCFGGQFADAFMPVDGNALNACAAFAATPNRMSEGCFPPGYDQTRNDYLAKVSSMKKCDGSQTFRDLHYQIVASPEGHDIPMLSSEYFLLFKSKTLQNLKSPADWEPQRRVMESLVLPALFSDEDKIKENISQVASSIQPKDSAISNSIRSLVKSIESSTPNYFNGSRFKSTVKNFLEKQLKTNIEKLDGTNADLLNQMNSGFEGQVQVLAPGAFGSGDQTDILGERLALLLASALAELELVKEAETDSAAKDNLRLLSELKSCEQKIL